MIVKIEELDILTKKLLLKYKKYKHWLFYGEMGAGKTTIIRSICKHLKVLDNVNSPTFNIINEYKNQNNEVIYHFDLYRLNNTKEAETIGFEEYLNSNAYCFIEWPDKIELEYRNPLKIRINIHDYKSNARELIIEK